MSADTVHAGVESQMRSATNVYDFADFTACVKKVPKTTIISPVNVDFKLHKREQSQPKLGKADSPLLAQCRVIQFHKDSKSIWVKKTYDDQQFVEFDFLAKKFNI